MLVLSMALAVLPIADPSAAPGDKVVCKRSMNTGTRFPSKKCRTRAQWDAIAEQHRRDMREQIDRPQIEVRRE